MRKDEWLRGPDGKLLLPGDKIPRWKELMWWSLPFIVLIICIKGCLDG